MTPYGEVLVDHKLRRALSHVLWIGGATDAGKTTLARMIAGRCGLQSYHYDQHDLPQMERLARRSSLYRTFLDASLDDRWVRPEPEDLLRFLLQVFEDRFPLVVEDLLGMSREPMIVAEGFGFTPELLDPVLSSEHQAVWLVPTEDFKRTSMERRNKPSFRDKVSDPGRATTNVLLRDMLLAEVVRSQAESRGLTVHRMEGARSVEEAATLIERHFQPYIASNRAPDATSS